MERNVVFFIGWPPVIKNENICIRDRENCMDPASRNMKIQGLTRYAVSVDTFKIRG